MKRAPFYASTAALCVAVACSSGADDHGAGFSPGGAAGDGGTAGAGGAHVTSHAGSVGNAGRVEQAGGATDGGSAGSATDGGSAAGGARDNEAGAAGFAPGMVITVTPSACSQAADWTAATPVAGVTTTSDEKLLAMTADELDMAFLRDGALLRAHRAAASLAFDIGTSVTVPDGYDLTAGAALSSDGETLLLVATGDQAFAQLTRNSRTGDFGATADATPFTGLNLRAVQTMERYVSPVLSPDGKTLIFTGYTPAVAGGLAIVYESALVNGSWAMPNNISDGIFDGTTEKRPLPSGLSSDSRTLFYYDESLAQEVARFRDRPDAPLYTVVDLGGRANAIPNVSCKRIYYSASGNILTEAD